MINWAASRTQQILDQDFLRFSSNSSVDSYIQKGWNAVVVPVAAIKHATMHLLVRCEAVADLVKVKVAVNNCRCKMYSIALLRADFQNGLIAFLNDDCQAFL